MADPIKLSQMNEMGLDNLDGSELLYAEKPNGEYGKIRVKSLRSEKYSFPLAGSYSGYHGNYSFAYQATTTNDRLSYNEKPLIAPAIAYNGGKIFQNLYISVPPGKSLYLDNLSTYMQRGHTGTGAASCKVKVYAEYTQEVSLTTNNATCTYLNNATLINNESGTSFKPFMITVGIFNTNTNANSLLYIHSFAWSGMMSIR